MLTLADFLPENTLERVGKLLRAYPTTLNIVRPRKSKLGDYRFPKPGKNHQISVNGNLSREEFLFTLLHEFAHLFAFEKYGRKIAPHGPQWKNEYRQLLHDFADVLSAHPRFQLEYTKQPARYSPQEADLDMTKLRVKDLQPGEEFLLEGRTPMRVVRKLRKHFLCEDPSNRALYRVNALATVRRVDKP